MPSLSFEKAWFFLSVVLLSFIYGFASHAWDLFPKSYVITAVNQAGRQLPTFLRGDESDEQTSPRVYDRSGARQVNPEATRPGLTLITSAWRPEGTERLQPGARLIDASGRVLHEWIPERRGLFPDAYIKSRDPMTAEFHGTQLLPNGDLLLALSYIGVVRLDACGTVQWTLSEGNHHSITWAEDGTFWMSAVSEERQMGSETYPDGYPGLEDSVWLDQLLQVADDGTVLQEINVLDILYDNGLERYLRLAQGRSGYTLENGDPVHLNDVEALPASMAEDYPLFEAGDLVVSLKHPNLVFVYDPDTGAVRWHADSAPNDTYHLIQHHDPDFMGDGWIGVFDNREDFTARGSMLGGSHIVAFQPHTDSMRVLFPTPLSDSIYTRNRGKWQYLDNGNLLITESNGGRVLEVTPEGETVWEWIQEPYVDDRVPFATAGTRHDLTADDVAAWSCTE